MSEGGGELENLRSHVAELVSRNEITECVHKYCYYFDSADLVGLRSLFSDDAVVDYGPEMGPLVGIDEIMTSVSAGLRNTFSATSHHISNILIDVHLDETATARSYLYAWHRYQKRPEIGYLWGQYRHEFRLEQGRWKICSLTLFGVATQDFHREKMHEITRAL